MNYVFLAAAFFAFHLLMEYLVDHLSIQKSFFISAAVSLGARASRAEGPCVFLLPSARSLTLPGR